jgi:phosphoglycerate dehydrogenase-like enzyme
MYNQILLIGLENYPTIINKTRLFSRKEVILENYQHVFDYIDAIGISIYENLEANFLNKFPNLKIINILGTSSDKIDKKYCENNNIKILNVTEYCDHETAEWIIWQLFNFFRLDHKSVYDKSLGIIGLGAVGKKLFQKAIGLGLQVQNSNNLENLFMNSDVISFNTKAYVPFLNLDLLELLKPHSLVINTCMGKIFEESYIKDFLFKRPDVTFLFDSIASKNYSLKLKNLIYKKEPAYLTNDSNQRLIDKFLINFSNCY